MQCILFCTQGACILIRAKKEAAQKFIDTVYEKSPQTRISIITYSSDAQKVVDFTNDKAKLKNAVSGIYSGGGTNIEAGLKKAYKLIKDEESLKKIEERIKELGILEEENED